MSYVDPNFKTKKALKEAVAAGKRVTVFNPGLGGPIDPNGTAYIEGPHYPAPHTFYCKVQLKDGAVVKVS